MSGIIVHFCMFKSYCTRKCFLTSSSALYQWQTFTIFFLLSQKRNLRKNSKAQRTEKQNGLLCLNFGQFTRMLIVKYRDNVISQTKKRTLLIYSLLWLKWSSDTSNVNRIEIDYFICFFLWFIIHRHRGTQYTNAFGSFLLSAREFFSVEWCGTVWESMWQLMVTWFLFYGVSQESKKLLPIWEIISRGN